MGGSEKRRNFSVLDGPAPFNNGAPLDFPFSAVGICSIRRAAQAKQPSKQPNPASRIAIAYRRRAIGFRFQ